MNLKYLFIAIFFGVLSALSIVQLEKANDKKSPKGPQVVRRVASDPLETCGNIEAAPDVVNGVAIAKLVTVDKKEFVLSGLSKAEMGFARMQHENQDMYSFCFSQGQGGKSYQVKIRD